MAFVSNRVTVASRSPGHADALPGAVFQAWAPPDVPISGYLKDRRARVGHELLLVPSVTGILYDDRGRILLAQHARRSPAHAFSAGNVAAAEVTRGLAVCP